MNDMPTFRGYMKAADEQGSLVRGSQSSQKVLYDWPLIDTDYLAATGAQDLYMFSTNTYQNGPAGVVGEQKQAVDYNMDLEGELAFPNRHEAIGMQVQVLADLVSGIRPTLAVLRQLEAWSSVRLLLGNGYTDFAARLQRIGGPHFDLQQNAIGAAFSLALADGDTPNDWYRFQESKMNDSEQDFAVVVSTTPEWDIAADMPNGLRVRIVLPGYLHSLS